MGLFKRHKQEQAEDIVETGPCEHGTLTPRWDRAEDIGKHDLATAWVCDACGAMLSPLEAEQLRDQEAERLRRMAQQGDAA
jgi:hypothetical protein